jgi:hypothetical protein
MAGNVSVLLSRHDSVVMRGWEAAIYRAYDGLLYSLVKLLTAPRQYFVKAKEAIMRQFEYYLDDAGQVRIRRNTGKRGVYQQIEGKMVKVSGEATGIDDFSIIPWKEANAGYYDQELGVHVDSKQQYRRLMKQEKLIPIEATRYCGSRAYRKQKAAEARSARTSKIAEQAFIKACRSGLGDAIAP